MNNNNYTYITLLSSKEYIWGVLILNKSLQNVKSKYPLTVCLTNDIVDNKIINILTQENINYLIVRKLQYKNNSEKGTILNTASKIHIFNFKQFDKIVYIDADTLVLKNIDNLFNYPNGSIVMWPESDLGMSGLFVFTPHSSQYQLYEFYECLIENMNGITDGTIIGNLFFPCLDNKDYQIPIEYLVQDVNIKSNYKVIHYGIKPFLLYSTKERLQYYKYSAYKKYFDEYLIPFEQKYKKYLTE